MHTKLGIYDSGIGGITLIKQYYTAMSGMYIADTAYFPYGNKTANELLKRAIIIINYLINNGCTTILLACNTISHHKNELQKLYPHIPIISIIDLTIAHITPHRYDYKPSIALMGTPYTIQQQLYKTALEPYYTVIDVPCDGLATLIETDKNTISYLQNTYPYHHKTDMILLCCTHYELIKDVFRDVFTGTDILFQSAYYTMDSAFIDTQQLQFYTTHDNNKAYNVVERYVNDTLKWHIIELNS